MQNHTAVHDWRDAIESGQLPVAKGIALDEDDRMRRDVISELMCHLRADLGAIATWTRAEKSASTFATWTGGTGHAAGWTSDPPHLN